MADEALESAEGDSPEEESSAPAGSFLSRNWPLPVFAVGAVMMAGAVWYWQGPSAHAHHERFLEDLSQARTLAYTNPYNARPTLGSLFGRLSRVPQAKGEVYFLLGHVNDELAIAAENDTELANQYRQAGLEAYSEADRVGVGPHLTLPLAESLGESIVAVGPTNRLSEANLKLSEAIARRDVIAWTIEKRRIQALLRAEPIQQDELDRALARWKKMETVPAEFLDETNETIAAINTARKEGTDWILGSTDADPRLEENHQAREIDDRLRLALDLEPPEVVVQQAQNEEQINDSLRSRILKDLARGAMRATNPLLIDAENFANRRLELQGASEELKADAWLDHAEIMLAANRPADAQTSLSKVEGTPEQKRRASYLLGKSLLDRAELVDRTPLEAWLKEVPNRIELSRWVARQRDSLPPVSQTIDTPAWSIPKLARQVLGFLDPASLKRVASRGVYQQAIATFAHVVEDPETPDEIRLETKLWTALALEGLDRTQQAKETYQAIVQELGSGPLDQAARLFLANILGKLDMPTESIELFKQTLDSAGNSARHQNKYLRPTQIRDMIVARWDQYQNHRKDFETAANYAALLQSFRQPNTEPGEPDDLFGRSSASLAALIKNQSEKEADPALKANLAERARARARQAGDAFLAVAKSREGSDEFPALLWEAATQLFDGHAYREAIPVFERFIVAHVGGPRDFLARIRVAECHLATPDLPKARAVLESALRESSTAVDRFRGRILLAECYSEIARTMPPSETADQQKEALYSLAQALLNQNLSSQNQELEPQAADWRESLFALAQLLLERRRYDEAIVKFQEHIRRYPSEPRNIDALNGIAVAYYESAEEWTPKLTAEGLSERDRGKARLERQRRLELARGQFEVLINQLTQRHAAVPLQRQDEVLLGTALARVGRIHMMLEQWEQAIKAYENLAFRYLDRPECLSAYIEMATAYQKLERPNDAATALRQALWVIDQMDERVFTQSDRKRDEIRQQIVGLLGNP
jgi:tetratricopeptide (TPR) repeat protein